MVRFKNKRLVGKARENGVVGVCQSENTEEEDVLRAKGPIIEVKQYMEALPIFSSPKCSPLCCAFALCSFVVSRVDVADARFA